MAEVRMIYTGFDDPDLVSLKQWDEERRRWWDQNGAVVAHLRRELDKSKREGLPRPVLPEGFPEPPGPYPVRNGIRCPECGEEMREDRQSRLDRNPPRVATWCDNCGASRWRIE